MASVDLRHSPLIRRPLLKFLLLLFPAILLTGFILQLFDVGGGKPASGSTMSAAPKAPAKATVTEQPTPSRQISLGDVAVLRIDGAADQLIALAVDEAALDEITKASVAHDTSGLLELMMAGSAFAVTNSTYVKVIDSGWFKCKVRVIDGQMAGRAGWVPREFLH